MKPILCFLLALGVSLPLPAFSQSKLMRLNEVTALPVTPAEARLAYGPDSIQFGDLRLPKGKGPFPVVVVIHGGCWVSAIADLHLMDPLATALTQAGYATWNLEYRRIGDPGGGWPNTFLDVDAGVNYLREIAAAYPIDLQRVVVAGHSAGGHLALWLGARDQLPAGSEIATPDPLPISGIISLAGIADLRSYLVREGRGCGSNVDELMGGLPEDFPVRYQQASPIELAPLGVRQVLITGKEDPIVPLAQVTPYFERAQADGDKVRSVEVDQAGHFEVIAPGSVAWPQILKAIRKMARP